MVTDSLLGEIDLAKLSLALAEDTELQELAAGRRPAGPTDDVLLADCPPPQGLRRHPASAALPDLPDHELAELAESLRRDGQRLPAIVTPAGEVVDGWHRCRAWLSLPAEWRAANPFKLRPYRPETDGSPEELALAANIMRRHLSPHERAAAALRLCPDRPVAEVAAEAQVGARTVERVRAKLRAAGELRTPADRAREALAEDPEGSDRELAQRAGVSRETIRLHRAEGGAAPAPGQSPHQAAYSGEVEYYSPPEWLAAARACMGGIDLDPASCELANQHVRAGRWHGREDDGLAQPWRGRVWLNPPYNREPMAAFVDKLLASPEVEQAIVLGRSSLSCGWGQALLRAASAVCFPAKRAHFYRPGPNGELVRHPGTPPGSHVLVGVKVDSARFRSAFGPVGEVLVGAEALAALGGADA